MGEVGLLRASGRVVVVDTTGVSGAQVLGNATQLARAVRNLLDNAVQQAVQEGGGKTLQSHSVRKVGRPSSASPMTAQESPFSFKNSFLNDLRGLTRHVLRSRGSTDNGSMAGEPIAGESVEQVAAGLVSPSPAS